MGMLKRRTPDPSGNPRRVAVELLRRLDVNCLWLFLSPDGTLGIRGIHGADPEKILTRRDVGLIYQFQDELKELVADRTLDGKLDSRLVAFLDDLIYYDGGTETRYEFRQGDLKVVREDLAERLVETGSASYHPGPS